MNERKAERQKGREAERQKKKRTKVEETCNGVGLLHNGVQY